MLSVPTEILYSRFEHGLHPIRVIRVGTRKEFEVLSQSGNTVLARYTSSRYLLAALTNTPRPRLSFDQYFGRKQNHPSSRLPQGGSALDLFISNPPTVQASQPIVSGHRARVTPAQPATPATDWLGIDLAQRGDEVRKLLFAGFGSRIMRSGYDAEEVLQEVFRGILARNRGKCPFDIRKSSFGHYVHMVCECVLNNYHRRESRRKEFEQVGMIAPSSMQDDAGLTGTVDAATIAERMIVSTGDSNGYDHEMNNAIQRLASHVERKRAKGVAIDSLAVRIAGLLVTGKNRREIAQDLNIPQTRVAMAIHMLREHAADWS